MSILTLATLVVMCSAWWSTGHLLCKWVNVLASTIAYNELQRSHPEVLAQVEEVIKPLSQFFMEPDYEFISAAEWPDDIKG